MSKQRLNEIILELKKIPKEQQGAFMATLSKEEKGALVGLVKANQQKKASTVEPVAAEEAPATVAIPKVKTQEEIVKEIVEHTNAVIQEHRNAMLELPKARLHLEQVTAKHKEASSIFTEAFKAKNGLDQGSKEDVIEEVQKKFDEANQNFGKIGLELEQARQTIGTHQAAYDNAKIIVEDAVSTLRYVHHAKQSVWGDFGAWLANNDPNSTFGMLLSIKEVYVGKEPKTNIFIDAQGNVIDNKNYVNNLFSYDKSTGELTFKIFSGFSITEQRKISTDNFILTFDKPLSIVRIGGGLITCRVGDYKLIKIEGNCKVYLLGEDQENSISISGAGIEIRQDKVEFVDEEGDGSAAAAADVHAADEVDECKVSGDNDDIDG